MTVAASAVPLAMAPPGAAGGQAGAGGALVQLAPLLIVVAIFYVLVFRPQQQKAKEHQTMLSALSKGDEVLTAGGLYGRIHGLTEQDVTLEIAPNVRVRVQRARIEGKVSGKEPSKEGKGGAKDKEAKA